MPRRGHVPKREVLADPLYNSVVVTKLINNIMLYGKKGVAQQIVYGAFDEIRFKGESSERFRGSDFANLSEEQEAGTEVGLSCAI